MSEANGTTMVVREVDATRALEPANMGQAYKLAGALAASGLLGRDKSRQEACFAIILAGRELGLTAMASLRSIHVIEGKTVLSADLIVALVRRSPDCEYLRLVEWTHERCVLEGKRRGDPPVKLGWSLEDATSAGLTSKDNWRKYPRAMLRSRASAELCRALWPEIAMGLYDPDEMQAAEPVRVPVQAPRSLDAMPDLDARPGMDAPRVQTPAEGTRAPAPPASEPRPVAPEGVMAEMTQERAADGVPEEDTAKAMDVLASIHDVADIDALGKLNGAVRALPESVKRPVVEAYNARRKALRGGGLVMP